ncbi:MAG: type II/IV secretion system protein [Planctomycetes bacterium]|nr:type II/IV secretion system protein [Planctomycetota bacterium]
MSRQKLGEMLLAAGSVTEQQLRDALQQQRAKRMKIGEMLIAMGATDEVTVARALARQAGLPFVDLDNQKFDKGRITPALLAKVPKETAARLRLVPLMEKDGKLVVAVDDPATALQLDDLSFVLNAEVTAALATATAVAKKIKEHYGVAVAAGAAPPQAAVALTSGDNDDDAPIIRLVQQMIEGAHKARASDIHVEPQNERLRVRYRIDGLLREVASHPHHLHAPLLSRLKIMAGMDIAERRKPQDGRILSKIEGRDLDLRVSVLPSSHGESMVMRLLDKERGLVSLTELGFGDKDFDRFKRIIARPNGIVLVTGPTGSGKTTTLYAALKDLNRADRKLITAEDPVEYQMPGINQCQVHSRIGLTFARILRAMLRQAPNVILVGEIRDKETAEVAIQASLTGHLVFSTLHTNDAPSALTRLVEMGVPPFLVSASVTAVMAQRLVRTLCKECRQPAPIDEVELAALQIKPEQAQGASLSRERGCDLCERTGFKGRKGIYELLEMDTRLREMTFRGEPHMKIREEAIAAGRMSTLLEDGQRKVLSGITSVREVLRVIAGNE